MAGDKCVFCDIVRGDASAVPVWENDDFLAFLDHRPLFRGHVLLVPKQHLRLLSDLPAALAGDFLIAAQRLERAVEDGLSVTGTMILINNVVSQSVPHLHLHVIPRERKDGLRFWLGPRHPYSSPEQAEEYAARIRAALPSLRVPLTGPRGRRLFLSSRRSHGGRWCPGRAATSGWRPPGRPG